ncbi:MAG TPA: MATE family efflux transporter [Alistipes communis]|nr:MATE family efflux transporter [Alistipes communis]
MRFTNRQILKITFPVLLSLMMEQLIGLTDTIYLGHVGEVELGASAIAGIFYLTIFMVGFGFFFSFAAAMFRAFYVGTTNTRILTANSVVMVLTNVVLNYLLIFGGWGIPPLGIAGAAIASVISEAVSLVFFVVYTYRRVAWRAYGLFRFRGIEWKILRQVFGVSVWIMLQEAIAFISWFIFFVAIENLGERPLAVTNMVRSISSVVFLFINAFASTASSLVGNLIGAGEADRVWGLCRRMVRLCFAFVLPVSLLFALLPRVVLGAYTGNAELIAAAVPSLWVMLTTIVPCVPAFIYQFSVSGTGNTRTALGITLVCVTAYTLYTLWLVYVLRADVALCWTADHVYYLISLALSYAYIRSGRWRRLKI